MVRSGKPSSWILTLGLVMSAACVQILQIPDRESTEHLRCDEGVCSCEVNFGDCDNDLSNGCETTLSEDAAHCGACGSSCGEDPCVDGECKPDGPCMGEACECEATQAECDGNPRNGCESLEDDPRHCGACDCDCGDGGSCREGRCELVLLAEESYPDVMALSDDRLYYTQFEDIRRVPKRGGTADSFYAWDLDVYDLEYADDRIYPLSQALAGLSVGNGGYVDLGFIPNTNAGGRKFAIFGDYMYIALFVDSAPLIYRKSRLVDEVSTIWDDKGTLAIAADEKLLVWARKLDFDNTEIVSFDGNTQKVITTLHFEDITPWEMVFEGTTLAATDSISGELWVLDIETLEERRLPEVEATGIAVGGGVVYFTSEYDKTVSRLAPSALESEVIANQVPLYDGGSDLLFDGEALYFPTVDGPARLAVCTRE